MHERVKSNIYIFHILGAFILVTAGLDNHLRLPSSLLNTDLREHVVVVVVVVAHLLICHILRRKYMMEMVFRNCSNRCTPL